jgi:hypothetical protein
VLNKEGFLLKNIDGRYVTDDGVVFKFKVEGETMSVDLPAPGNRTINRKFQIYDVIDADFKFGNERQKMLKHPQGKYTDGKLFWWTTKGEYIELKPKISSPTNRIETDLSYCSIL